MKVSLEGKIRKVTNWPESMDELRKVVSRKFTERSLFEENDESQLKTSVNIDQQNSVVSKSKAGQRRQLIDWSTTCLFYEDSEGDLNVISEEEDLADAHTYALMKMPSLLKCSLVDKEFFNQIRDEQNQSLLNQS